MNSFYIPALAGQIYAMAGMQTQLHAVINKAGRYEGFSANYSGAGFSDMRFTFRGMSAGDFDQWVKTAKAGGGALTRDAYLKLEQPSEREPVRSYAAVAPGLYDAILNQCVEPDKMCMNQMAEIDERGGLGGPQGAYNVASLDSAPRAMPGRSSAPSRTYVRAMCMANDPVGASVPRAPPTL
jgi:cytochrome o ubiquinol oxidase subunit 2